MTCNPENKCATGEMQSPIFIPANLTSIGKMHLAIQYSIGLVNVNVEYDKFLRMKVEEPLLHRLVIDGNATFFLKEVYIHFGSDVFNTNGSEHVLPGSNNSVEAQFINTRSPTKGIFDSLSEDGAVVALSVAYWVKPVLKTHSYGTMMCNELETLFGCMEPEGCLNAKVRLANLIPDAFLDIYTYKGSLTHPPCSEGVNWFVMSPSFPITIETVTKLRHKLLVTGARRAREPKPGEVKRYTRKFNFTHIKPQ